MLLNSNSSEQLIELTNGVVIRADLYKIQTELNNVQNNVKLLVNPIEHIKDDEKKIMTEKYETKINELKNEFYWAQQASQNPTLIKRKFSGNLNGKRILNG